MLVRNFVLAILVLMGGIAAADDAKHANPLPPKNPRIAVENPDADVDSLLREKPGHGEDWDKNVRSARAKDLEKVFESHRAQHLSVFSLGEALPKELRKGGEIEYDDEDVRAFIIRFNPSYQEWIKQLMSLKLLGKNHTLTGPEVSENAFRKYKQDTKNKEIWAARRFEMKIDLMKNLLRLTKEGRGEELKGKLNDPQSLGWFIRQSLALYNVTQSELNLLMNQFEIFVGKDASHIETNIALLSDRRARDIQLAKVEATKKAEDLRLAKLDEERLAKKAAQELRLAEKKAVEEKVLAEKKAAAEILLAEKKAAADKLIADKAAETARAEKVALKAKEKAEAEKLAQKKRDAEEALRKSELARKAAEAKKVVHAMPKTPDPRLGASQGQTKLANNNSAPKATGGRVLPSPQSQMSDGSEAKPKYPCTCGVAWSGWEQNPYNRNESTRKQVCMLYKGATAVLQMDFYVEDGSCTAKCSAMVNVSPYNTQCRVNQ